MNIKPRHSSFALALWAAVLPLAAGASQVTLNGSGQLSWTDQYLGSASPPGYTTNTGNGTTTGNNYILGVPGQYTFLDQFTNSQSALPAIGTSSVGSYAFQDSYVFTLGSNFGSGEALVASLGLCPTATTCTFGITNLQFRLYQATAPAVGGLPAGTTVLTPWQGQAGIATVADTASFTGLLANTTYVLDIAGTATGAAGGTYVGQLNVVPLPGAVWLMGSGLLALCFVLRHRGGPRRPEFFAAAA